MFFKRKNKFDWLLTLFLLIALAIIVSTGILVGQIFSKASQKAQVRMDQQAESGIHYSPEELLKNYAESVLSLQNKFSDSKLSTEEFLSKAEEELMNIRVPKEMMDKHLQAVLILGRLQGQLNSLDEGSVKQNISEVLEGLGKQE